MARHVLGISGGKDSAALAIYLNNKFPSIDVDYYFCDTGKELDETYSLIERLEGYLGKKVTKIVADEAKQNATENPFDHFMKAYRGYLPSSQARWCTKKLKLEPFETYVGDLPVISYVGIRGDEDREGYISKKSNIQSIFPFRKNIWSEDVITKALHPSNFNLLNEAYTEFFKGNLLDKVTTLVREPLSSSHTRTHKLQELLKIGTVEFNKVVFKFLRTTDYPLSLEDDFALLESDEVLVRDDIFRLLRESGVGVPEYYEKIQYQVDGQTGEYARSRSGCYFCFFQQKIEWVWLYEQHPELFKQAMQYEDPDKGFTWNQGESLSELIERIDDIKRESLKRSNRQKTNGSKFLIDNIEDAEGIGCASCFI